LLILRVTRDNFEKQKKKKKKKKKKIANSIKIIIAIYNIIKHKYKFKFTVTDLFKKIVNFSQTTEEPFHKKMSVADTSFDDSDATLILPPSSYLRRTPTETLSTASSPLSDAAQSAAEIELRTRAEAMFATRDFYGATQKAWLDAACLRRHLKACKWVVEDAAALLAKVLAYRDERQIWTLRSAEDGERSARVGDQVRSGKCYRNGFDKQGRPIIYMRDRRNRRHDGFNKKFPDILLHLMNCLEQAARSMPLDRGVEQWVFVIDMAGFSLLGGDDMSHSRDSIDIFNSVYAERLGVAFILNAPWYFNVFYKMMAPFVDPETKVKFKVLSGSTADNLETLLQVIDKSVLESVYGGDNKCKFNFDAYYTEETKQIHAWYANEAKLAAAASGTADDDGDGDDDGGDDDAAAAENGDSNGAAAPAASSKRKKKKRSTKAAKQ
jgi:hypothetical protein